jgi:hypothetical protein
MRIQIQFFEFEERIHGSEHHPKPNWSRPQSRRFTFVSCRVFIVLSTRDQ